MITPGMFLGHLSFHLSYFFSFTKYPIYQWAARFSSLCKKESHDFTHIHARGAAPAEAGSCSAAADTERVGEEKERRLDGKVKRLTEERRERATTAGSCARESVRPNFPNSCFFKTFEKISS